MAFSESNGAPPQVGGCVACTVGSDDENCMRFIGTYNLTNVILPYNFTASRIVSGYFYVFEFKFFFLSKLNMAVCLRVITSWDVFYY